MLTLAVLALALVILWIGWRIYDALWRLGGIIATVGMVLERVANRAAVRNDEEPITTPDDEEWAKIVRHPH